ncbi:hypothetical protein BGZ96_001491 [Linnemannia gamsii]|uniref:Uncharacterized protein n=1 Tax=Linnemannia gamsii TaxID=64522 RepID=A0ABQ7KBL8_9FUNG|nr:hypothetical protein BGZ96_001491 [Linnemannia gamsii]
MDRMSATPTNNSNTNTNSQPQEIPRRRRLKLTVDSNIQEDVDISDPSLDPSRPKRGRPKRTTNVEVTEDDSLNGADTEDTEDMSVYGETNDERDIQDNRANQKLSDLASSYHDILNPSQDDDLDGDLDLELKFTEFRKEEMKPHFKMAQDGVVCCFCGVIAADNMQYSTTYPAIYVCKDCVTKQERQALAPVREVAPTVDDIDLIQIHREQLKDRERDMQLNLFDWIPEKFIASKQIESLMKSSIIPTDVYEQDLQWSKAISKDEKTWIDYPPKEQLLVAGGMSWTIDESTHFFQGLRRFGKHNVWAIQELIKTRSLAEVVTMVETMEMELARRKTLGLKTIRLSEMPMATEVNDEVIAIEEMCASRLVDQEMESFWSQHTKSPAESIPEIVDKSRLFNMRTLSDLSSRLYIQNEGAGMEREVVLNLYDALKEWLSPVVKELVALQHERHRVTALLTKEECVDTPGITEMDVFRTLHARQLPLDVDAFFSTAHNRLQHMLFDDGAVVPETAPNRHQFIPSISLDYGKQYYLNTTADLEEAEAEDSDQDMDTDDGVLAEEEGENTLEAPLPVHQSSLNTKSANSGGKQSMKVDREQWESLWSTGAREAQRISANVIGHTAEGCLMSLSSGNRPTLSYNSWRQNVARLKHSSLALPSADSEASCHLNQDTLTMNVQSMNKTVRSHEQRLYLESLPKTPPSIEQELKKLKRIAAHVSILDSECKMQARYKNSEQPGYGPLPKNMSLLLDPTREVPTTGYGIGKRNRGGLWQMDKYVDDSGYITVSGSDDEEEEDLGCQRQMKAEADIEAVSQVLGWRDIFPVAVGNSNKRQKRESTFVDPESSD